VGVEEVRWDEAGRFFFGGKGSKNHPLGTGFFVKREEFLVTGCHK
jgi:hypothetical protein